jgi:hypothetical protein
MSAGKGDSPRNCFSQKYRNNFDRIFSKATRCTKGTREKEKPSTQASPRTVPPYPHEL